MERHVAAFLDVPERLPREAREYLDQRFEPFLERDLRPRVYEVLSQTERELRSQVRAVARRAGTTTRFALWTSAGAALLALVLGFLVWRSISGPIVALQRAAVRLGEGHLETRVEVRSRDEIGELGRAFNRMADELERTTVSVAEKELLLREVHHRVKNNMQVVSSLLAMQAGQTADVETVERLGQSQDRIRSMALIHEQLCQSADLAAIDSKAYIEVLTGHLRGSFDGARCIEITLDVEDVGLDVDQSLACGLIINELVTNAFKHAFAGRSQGAIEVSLRQDEFGRRVLSVSDDGLGVGNPARVTESQALGMSLVTMLARQLGGQLSVRGERGTQVRIAFPRRVTEAVA